MEDRRADWTRVVTLVLLAGGWLMAGFFYQANRSDEERTPSEPLAAQEATIRQLTIDKLAWKRKYNDLLRSRAGVCETLSKMDE